MRNTGMDTRLDLPDVFAVVAQLPGRLTAPVARNPFVLERHVLQIIQGRITVAVGFMFNTAGGADASLFLAVLLKRARHDHVINFSKQKELLGSKP